MIFLSWHKFAIIMLIVFAACTINVANSANNSDKTIIADKDSNPKSCHVRDPDLQQQYTGDCKDGWAYGYGVARGANGAYYQGYFNNGYAHGYGVKLYANGDTYVGDWQDGYRDGLGVYEYGEQSPWRGDKYVGHWQRDQRHGHGTYKFYPNGDSFEADWDQGQTEQTATPLVIRRKRTAEDLIPILGKIGTKVCSVLTDGASPDRVAYGVVTAVVEDRLQVMLTTQDVLKHSNLTLNPRWDVITQWSLCE